MGLFDFLSKTPLDDDLDDAASPSDAAPPAPQRAEPEPEPAPVQPATPAPAPAKVQAKPAPTNTPEPQASDMPDFGIQKAIELMRDLPQQNVELVVQVVKKTLESMQVDVATIIDDAKSRQAKIQGRIKGLEEEIAEFKEEIAAREEEITALKSDFAETRQVRERLEMAQKGTIPKADVIAPPTGRGPGAPGTIAPPGGGDPGKPGA
jgi:hypothetical protein